jgi:hypothetical protein
MAKLPGLSQPLKMNWRISAPVGLTQLFVDAAGDVGRHLLPRQGMVLAVMLPEEIQQERFF